MNSDLKGLYYLNVSKDLSGLEEVLPLPYDEIHNYPLL